MPEVITFKGATIWSTATNGAGWKFVPGVRVQQKIVAGPSIGIGHWIKPANVEPAVHTLDIQWRTTDPGAIKTMLEGLALATAGDLVVPVWGTFRCYLASPGALEPMKSDAATGWIVSTTLTFEEYP